MDVAEREDTILTLMRCVQRTGSGTGPEEVAGQTGLPVQRIRDILGELVRSGEVSVQADGTYLLTETGIAAAERVMRRHHVLESFLQEMLGMDHEDAHAQACTMEHHTSDDTINRLRRFLHETRECPGNCLSCGPRHQFRSLLHCANGETVIISAIKGCRRASRLADLGLIPGEKITIKQRMADTLLVQVKGCDIAISPEIARSVLVGVQE